MSDLLTGPLRRYADLPHVWWGVSVENVRHGLPRVEDLRRVPAAVRFLSVEPLLEDLGALDLSGIHWVIVGGESGRGARPMERRWVERLRDRCLAACVKFFFKQWGGTQKKKAGRRLDDRTYDEMPDIPPANVPDKAERRSRAETLGLTPGGRTNLVVIGEGGG